MNEEKKGFRRNERYAPKGMINLCNAAKLAGNACADAYGDSYSTNTIRFSAEYGYLLGVAYALSIIDRNAIAKKELPF